MSEHNVALIVKEILQQSKLTIDNERRKETEDRLNIYHDHYKQILSDELDKQFSKKTRAAIKLMIDDSQNILKRIVNDVSIVYEKEAKRSYIIGEGEKAKEDENYQNIIKQIPVDLVMEQVNQFTNVANETIVGIMPRSEKIEYDVITPDMVEIFQDEHNPTEILAILITITSVDTIDNHDVIKVYWDVFGNHLLFNEDDQRMVDPDNKEGINPYKDPFNKDRTILPYVIFHKSFPVDTIFDRTSGNDLISATKQTGVLLTHLNYLLKVNSFKQLGVAGASSKDIPAEVVFDPLHPIVVTNPNAKIGSIDHQATYRKYNETIMQKVGSIANNYGLSLDNFQLTLSAQSGFALRIKNQGLEKAVNKQKKFYRFYEKELFWKTKIVNNTMFKKKIADDGQFKIDFAELVYPTSPDEIRKQWAFDLKLGAKNILEYVQEVNPDIKSNDDAETVLKKNDETNKRIQAETGINIDKLVNGLLKTNGNGGGGSPDQGGETSPLI